MLPERWYPLKNFAKQMAYVHSPHRFNVVPAGRRSGKTERAKRKLVLRALDTTLLPHDMAPRFFAGAPTRMQAKQIFWDDLKALSKPFWADDPMESELKITLVNGAELVVFGMDRPQRIEGQPWDGGVLDEYADIPADAWGKNIRPALSTPGRRGWCDLIGVPEGRNHYYDLWMKAHASMMARGPNSEWGAYTWFSSEVLSPEEVAAAKADLDPLTFAQEYEASFVSFQGRAYYTFNDQNKRPVRSLYNPKAPLVFCFDFNVSPGVAVVLQECRLPDRADTSATVTCVLGEVWIPENSNTPAVCRKLVADWGKHTGVIKVYGDATGGAKGTAKLGGSDWDLVRQELRAAFGAQHVDFKVPSANPSERSRVNAVNTRCRRGDGTIHLYVDSLHAPHVVMDLEGVQHLEGGSGELDKKKNRQLTHISDALGYYIVAEFPVQPRTAIISPIEPF